MEDKAGHSITIIFGNIDRVCVSLYVHTCVFFSNATCMIRVQPLTAELSHLPPLDLRFRGLAGTACAASLLLHQFDICLLAGWRERVAQWCSMKEEA